MPLRIDGDDHLAEQRGTDIRHWEHVGEADFRIGERERTDADRATDARTVDVALVAGAAVTAGPATSLLGSPPCLDFSPASKAWR